MPATSSNGHSLTGRVAAVTGAAGDIGRVVLHALAAQGATPVAIDVNPERLEALRGQMGTAELLELMIDVSDEHACREGIATIKAKLGRLDILVNCAGITGEQGRVGSFPRFWERDPADWRRVQLINSHGPFHMAHHAVRPMIERGWGRIINISTSLSTMLTPGVGAYGPSKAALEASSAIWAKELIGTGVTVNVLIPGGPIAGSFAPPGIPPEMLLKADIMGPPAQWLASDASSGTTGKRLIARQWDASLPSDKAAAACSAPAGGLSESNLARAARSAFMIPIKSN